MAQSKKENTLDAIFITRRGPEGQLIPITMITPDMFAGARTMRFTLTRDKETAPFSLDYFQCIEMLAPEHEPEG